MNDHEQFVKRIFFMIKSNKLVSGSKDIIILEED